MKKILICIVLYKQKIVESNAFICLSTQETNIRPFFYLFDNSPDKNTIYPLATNVYYIHSPKNPGLSVAFNNAAKYALDYGFEWILLSDQDTCFSNDFLKKMQRAIMEYPYISLFAPIVKLSNGTIFSPCEFHNMISKPLCNVSLGVHFLYKTMPINSGLIIKTSHFFDAGGYNEKLCVDFCDYAFLNKVKYINSKYVLVDSIVVQSFSNEEVDQKKLLERFHIFISDAKNYSCDTYMERVGLFYSVLRHTMALTIRTKCTNFLKVLFKNYFLTK